MLRRRRSQSLASIGSGIIGQGWAILFTCKGFETKLYNPRQERLALALKHINSTMQFLDDQNVLAKNGSVSELLSRISLVTDLKSALSNVSFAQESLPERGSVKGRLFRDMDRLSDRETVLSSSTSTLSMTDIQKGATRHPERCVTSHPFNPPYLVPLVEVIPGAKTSEKTIQRTFDFFTALERVPIIVRKEVDGFVGNRLAAALWREAYRPCDKGSGVCRRR